MGAKFETYSKTGKERYAHKGVPRKHLSTGRKFAIRAMWENGMSQKQIAILEGVSLSTVNLITKDDALKELDQNYVNRTKRLLSSRFYVMADKAIDKAGENKRLDKMNSYQLAMIGAVSVDKARLMDGMSTENVSVRSLNDHIVSSQNELDTLKQAIMSKIDGKHGIIEVGESAKMNVSHGKSNNNVTENE
jgi:hypothetical protein